MSRTTTASSTSTSTSTSTSNTTNTLSQARELTRRCAEGSLSPRRLALAAHLGDAGAALARQSADRRFVPPAREPSYRSPRAARAALITWIEGLAPWGPEVWLRAALAALEAAHAADEQGGTVPALKPTAQCTVRTAQTARAIRASCVCLKSTRRWLSCPCPQHARLAAATASMASHAAGSDPLDTAATELARAAALAHAEPRQSLKHALACVLDAAWIVHPQALRQAIQARLVPWTLGYADPSARAA